MYLGIATSITSAPRLLEDVPRCFVGPDHLSIFGAIKAVRSDEADSQVVDRAIYSDCEVDEKVAQPPSLRRDLLP